jgi:hypothetical protein
MGHPFTKMALTLDTITYYEPPQGEETAIA